MDSDQEDLVQEFLVELPTSFKSVNLLRFLQAVLQENGSKSNTKQSEYEAKIPVGRDYQAVCPKLIPGPERKSIILDRALLVWSPTNDIPDTKVEEYISVAKEKYGYSGEQALGMLFWHKHDLERALMDLANFTPFPEEWTELDKVIFEDGFKIYGKSFYRIRKLLPDKSIASLVKYYYSWKHTRRHQSFIERHGRHSKRFIPIEGIVKKAKAVHPFVTAVTV